jgi:hypothetical protein
MSGWVGRGKRKSVEGEAKRKEEEMNSKHFLWSALPPLCAQRCLGKETGTALTGPCSATQPAWGFCIGHMPKPLWFHLLLGTILPWLNFTSSKWRDSTLELLRSSSSQVWGTYCGGDSLPSDPSEHSLLPLGHSELSALSQTDPCAEMHCHMNNGTESMRDGIWTLHFLCHFHGHWKCHLTQVS